MLTTQGGVQAENNQSNLNNGSLLAHSCAGGCGAKKAGRSGCGNKSGCGGSYSGCGNKQTGKSGCGSYSGCGNKSDQGNIAGCGANSCSGKGGSNGNRNYVAEVNQNLNASNDQYTSKSQLMTEDQLKSQLNDQGKQLYNSLTPEGKAMAVKLASRSCKGTNDCKGQNACKAEDHSCAGKGSCAGTSICSFKDKNMAVKIAAQKQAEKRTKTNSGSY